MRWLQVISILLLLVFNQSFAFCQFGSRNLLTGFTNEAEHIELSDLDGDGDRDVVAIGGSELVWYENLNNEAFGIQEFVIENVGSASSFRIGDLDQDGDSDIMFCRTSLTFGHGLYWIENSGAANFSPPVLINGSMRSSSLMLEDFDNDGLLDIISGSISDTRYYFIKNLGSGQFSSASSIYGPFNSTFKLTCPVDLNQDGNLDYLTAIVDNGGNPNLYVKVGDGVGGFGQTAIVLNEDFSFRALTTGDVDQDGDPDIIVTGQLYSTAKLGWYENLGNDEFSGFQEIDEHIDVGNGAATLSISVADLTGDGKCDVAWGIANVDDYEARWYTNEGVGVFSSPHYFPYNYNLLRTIRIDDVNGDGRNDLLMGAVKNVLWHENLGNNVFGWWNTLTSDINQIAFVTMDERNAEVSDIDSDGQVDFLFGGYGKLAWYRNTGLGLFSTEKMILSGDDNYTVSRAADVTGDSLLDVVFMADTGLCWVKNFGSDNWGNLSVIDTSLATGSFRRLKVIDLDQDSDDDIVISIRKTAGAVVDVIGHLENQGNGQFGSFQQWNSTPSSFLSRLPDFTFADINGDSLTDILYSANDEIRAMQNLGFGQFTDLLLLSSTAYYLHYLDVDQDGFKDILFTVGTQINWAQNLGNGIYDSPQNLFSASFLQSLLPIDIDGDQDIDLALTKNTHSTVYWHENTGNAVFGNAQILTEENEGTHMLLAADLTLDGLPEVISVEASSQFPGDKCVGWFENLNIAVEVVEDKSNNQNLLIYPNPYLSTDFATITNLPNAIGTHFSITDMQGRLIWDGVLDKSTPFRLGGNITGDGVYILRVFNELTNFHTIEKLVVQ